MTRKLSTTDWLLIAFTLMLAISATGTIIAYQYFGSGYSVFAFKLNSKPENSFVLNNPDNYILEAIANNHSSVFRTLDLTQYDELEDEGFYNIEYNGSYYNLKLASVDSFAPLYSLVFTGFSLIGLMIVVSLKIAQRNNRRYYDKSKDFSKTFSYGNALFFVVAVVVGALVYAKRRKRVVH